MDTQTSSSHPQQHGEFPQCISEARKIAWPPGPKPQGSDALYRVFSIYPSYWLAQTSISPNQITVFWIFLGILGVVCLGNSLYSYRVAGSMLLEVSYLFDFVDGEVARLQRRCSDRGFFLDLVGHGLIKTALFLGVGFGGKLFYSRPQWVLLCLIAAVSMSSISSLSLCEFRAVATQKAGPATSYAKDTFFQGVLSFSSILFESPGLYGLTLIAALCDRLSWLVVFYGIISPVWLLFKTWRRYNKI